MLEDARSAPEIFQTTNYWSVYNDGIVPELRSQGLTDFRRRRGTMLHKFSANDLYPPVPLDFLRIRYLNNRYTRRVRIWHRILKLLNRVQVATSHRQTRRLVGYYAARSKGKGIGEFEASLIGNPEDVIRIDGKAYTTSVLRYYLSYLYCSNFIDFSSVKLLIELGSGSGKQIEVLKKLHPDICFLVFDIPPQLYVCEEYLTAAFPDSVVGYAVTRDMDELPQNRNGKIFIMGNWRLPIIDDLKVDLFWNSASFQEMEPDVVANYLRHVNGSCKSAYLSEEMEGSKVAHAKGERGVLTTITLDDYRKGLPDLELVDLKDKWTILPTTVSDSFWRRTRLK